jgi:uncharacterized membrane protein
VTPLIILVVSLLVFRGLGAVGLERFASWQDAARYALALMFLFTGTTHFTRMRTDYIRMVPRVFPYPGLVVDLSGALEIIGAIGLLIPSLAKWAGLGLVLLLVGMFSANFNAAQNNVDFRGRPPTPLWLRLPIQLVYVGVALWTTQL